MAWAGVGNVVYVVCQYAMLVVIARLGDAEAVGQFALALGICAPIVIMTQMQLRQLQVTDSQGRTSFADYFRHRLLWTLVAVVLVLGVALAYGGPTGLVIAGVGAAKAFESVSDVIQGHLQRHERMDLVSASMISRGLLSIGVLALVMHLTGSLAFAVFALAVAWGALLLVLDLPLRHAAGGQQSLSPGHGSGRITELTKLAAPLAVGSTLISVSANLPRYFLDAFYGKEAVALFSIAAIPLALASVMLGSLTQASLPRAASYYQNGNFAGFHRIAARLTALNVIFGFLCALGLWVVGRPLISMLFTPAYGEAVPTMVIMSIGLGLGGFGAYGGLVLAAARRFRLQLANVLFMVALQLGVCWTFVRSWGVTGAAYSEVARYAFAALFLLIVGAVVVRRHQAQDAGPEPRVLEQVT